MPLQIRRHLPESVKELKSAVYDGIVFILPASAESQALVLFAQNELEHAFNDVPDIQKVHEHFDGHTIYRMMAGLRETLSTSDLSRRFIACLAGTLGIQPEQPLFEVLRPRCNPHQEPPATEAIYNTIHRDTWYATPQCQLNWWIPLFDASSQQTFTVYPRYFGSPIANTSGDFDYEHWSATTGFQSNKATNPMAYPTTTVSPEDPESQQFSCKAGDIVIFSGAHLHKTAPNHSGLSRFSIDFRTVDLADKQQGLGAPNTDNQSRGDASVDYFPLGLS